MVVFIMGAFSALWLGILTSISPCPLATNITAISFIGKRVGSLRNVLLSGLLYTCGRMITYLIISVAIVMSLLSIPSMSLFLQEYMNKILGPLLILAGMFLLDLISIGFSGSGIHNGIKERAEGYGIWGAFLLGVAFALSFCPVSAGLFFGSLIPLSVKYHSPIVFPLFFGIGTGLPVLVFAVMIALGAQFVGNLFDKITRFEVWARRITGTVFIIVGMYFSLSYIFGVF